MEQRSASHPVCPRKAQQNHNNKDESGEWDNEGKVPDKDNREERAPRACPRNRGSKCAGVLRTCHPKNDERCGSSPKVVSQLEEQGPDGAGRKGISR